MPDLFTIPYAAQGIGGAGSLTVSTPVDKVYLITFQAPPDNRMVSSFLQAFLLALDIIEYRYPTGVVVSTSGIAKFYSNGLDLEHVVNTPGFWEDSLYAVFKRLSTYPMPTIALINGHAFAGGLLLAMHHDYRVMNPNKGFVCMNEMDLGALMETPFLAIFREKVTPSVYRDILLGAKRYPATEALKAGIIDELGGLEETLKMIEQRTLLNKGLTGVYGSTKEDIYRMVVGFLGTHNESVGWRQKVNNDREYLKSKALERVADWEKKNGKAKL